MKPGMDGMGLSFDDVLNNVLKAGEQAILGTVASDPAVQAAARAQAEQVASQNLAQQLLAQSKAATAAVSKYQNYIYIGGGLAAIALIYFMFIRKK